MSADFDPASVDLDTADPRDVICYLNAGGNDYDGRLGARIGALFTILIVSTAVTFFPVVAARVKRFNVPLNVYLFARYFGAGVIIATAFIHLLDPAYEEIGPASCVGMTGGWAEYAWVPGIVLTSCMLVFLLDFLADVYVERRHGHGTAHQAEPDCVVTKNAQDQLPHGHSDPEATDSDSDVDSIREEKAFQEQIAAFLVLEFGVIFHSVIIGLNLGVVGEEFNTLFPVIVFHQSFEGLGVGSRLSSIPFPRRYRWMPWALCLAYGLTTPIAIAIGLGVRTTYDSASYTANVVSGVLDAISAGILLYTGLVELLARDFVFNPKRPTDKKTITLMLVSLYLGIIIMALLGKWA